MKKQMILSLIISILLLIIIIFVSYSNLTGKAVQGPPANAGEKHIIGPSASEQECLMNCMKCTSPGVGCTGNQEQCMLQCNAKKPEATEETSCMETCVAKGCGEYDFSCQEKNQAVCEKECDMIKEPPAKSEEEKCIRDCVNAESPGLICRPGEGGEKGDELCQKCAKSCEHLYAGPCLTEIKLEAAKSECNTCEHCYGKPIMGDSGEGYDCIVKIECADASGEFGDEPGSGSGIAKVIETAGGAVGNAVESVVNFVKGLFD
jgi:hypothetical protein